MSDEHDSGDAAAEAFEAVRAEVALLRRAVEGLAAERADAPDYAPTLGTISHNQMVAAQRLEVLAQSPNLSLTPAAIGKQVERAAADMRVGERQVLDGVRRELEVATREMTARIASARTADRQFYWVLGSTLGGFIAGMLVWIAMTGPIARELPASWQVAEGFAANTMGMSMWEAGAKLMGTADTSAWNQIAVNNQIVEANREVVSACRKVAAKERKTVRCIIRIRT